MFTTITVLFILFTLMIILSLFRYIDAYWMRNEIEMFFIQLQIVRIIEIVFQKQEWNFNSTIIRHSRIIPNNADKKRSWSFEIIVKYHSQSESTTSMHALHLHISNTDIAIKMASTNNRKRDREQKKPDPRRSAIFEFREQQFISGKNKRFSSRGERENYVKFVSKSVIIPRSFDRWNAGNGDHCFHIWYD